MLLKKSIFNHGKRLLVKKYRSVIRGIEKNEWLNQRFIFEELFRNYSQQDYVFSDENQATFNTAISFR